MASQQNQQISNIRPPKKKTKNKELRVGVGLDMDDWKKNVSIVHKSSVQNQETIKISQCSEIHKILDNGT